MRLTLSPVCHFVTKNNLTSKLSISSNDVIVTNSE